jgi:hypothetical protein
MTTDEDRATQAQNMVMLALALTAAKSVYRNKIVILIGLIAVAHLTRRQGAIISAAVRRRAATNVAAWRHS